MRLSRDGLGTHNAFAPRQIEVLLPKEQANDFVAGQKHEVLGLLGLFVSSCYAFSNTTSSCEARPSVEESQTPRVDVGSALDLQGSSSKTGLIEQAPARRTVPSQAHLEEV